MTTAAGARILVVDDEPPIRRGVRLNLVHHGFQVEAVENGRQALTRLGQWRPDLILLDLGLPDMDGLEVIRQVRATAGTPIIVLTVRGAERDKVAALDLGADDYLTKPFGVNELLARIRVALRHAVQRGRGTEAFFQTGGLEVDIERRLVHRDGQEIHLSPTEYDLLKAFIGHPNRVLTDNMLLQTIWGQEYGSEVHYLHVYIARLRKKLEPDPQNPKYLRTEPGVGYRLVADED